MSQNTLTRRRMLASSAAGIAALSFSNTLRLFAGEKDKCHFKIGACDWSMKRRGRVDALELAKEIGLDGVQISVPNMKLCKAEHREEYLRASKATGIEICSLGIGMLHTAPYCRDPRAEGYIEKCIDFMPKMNQKILLMPFFGKADIKGRPDAQEEVIRRLKKVAPKAEKAGVVLALETVLSADKLITILDAVGSPAIQVYYDTANSNDQGYDIYKEIPQLGRDRICQIHCKENGCLLGQGDIDFRKVRQAIDGIGYRDWLVIEGSIVKEKSLLDCYTKNRMFLQKIFA